MEWSRDAVLSLARLSCSTCGGEGIKREKMGQIIPCSCVLRTIFRACYARFRVSVEKEKYMSRVSFEHFGGRERRMMWSRKDEEYAADFHLVSRRVLDPFHYQVFSYHFLLAGDWRLCCRRLKIDRGQFFHAVYRVQEMLGRVFYELEPYGLFPPRDYFTTRITDPRPRGPVPPRPGAAKPGVGCARPDRTAGLSGPAKCAEHRGPRLLAA
jgi:hypothetical protein